jgi:hypothetical protein
VVSCSDVRQVRSSSWRRHCNFYTSHSGRSIQLHSHLPCHLHFTLTIRDLTVHVTRREFDSGTSQICSTHTCDLRMGNQKGSW